MQNSCIIPSNVANSYNLTNGCGEFAIATIDNLNLSVILQTLRQYKITYNTEYLINNITDVSPCQIIIHNPHVKYTRIINTNKCSQKRSFICQYPYVDKTFTSATVSVTNPTLTHTTHIELITLSNTTSITTTKTTKMSVERVMSFMESNHSVSMLALNLTITFLIILCLLVCSSDTII